jgi:hypothetical protein
MGSPMALGSTDKVEIGEKDFKGETETELA